MLCAASGRYFENHVVMELMKSFACSPDRMNLTYYRDSSAREIDLLVEAGRQLHPLKIRRSANPDRREMKRFRLPDKAALSRGSGGIVCMCEEVLPIDGKDCFIPCNLL